MLFIYKLVNFVFFFWTQKASNENTAVSTLVFSRITPLFYNLSKSFLARCPIFTSYCKIVFPRRSDFFFWSIRDRRPDVDERLVWSKVTTPVLLCSISPGPFLQSKCRALTNSCLWICKTSVCLFHVREQTTTNIVLLSNKSHRTYSSNSLKSFC